MEIVGTPQFSGVASPKIFFGWERLILGEKTPLKAQNNYMFQTFWVGCMAPLCPHWLRLCRSCHICNENTDSVSRKRFGGSTDKNLIFKEI